jgi:hypothetical protein
MTVLDGGYVPLPQLSVGFQQRIGPFRIRFPDGNGLEGENWADLLHVIGEWLGATGRLTLTNDPDVYFVAMAGTAKAKSFRHPDPIGRTGFVSERNLGRGGKDFAISLLVCCGVDPNTVHVGRL